MTQDSGIGVDEFELRFDTASDRTDHSWEIWQDGEFVVGGRTAVKAIEALASVADAGNWYTNSDGNPWPLMDEKVTQEPLTDITALEKDDGVYFEGLSAPLVVVSAATSPSDKVQLRGPDGGEYRADSGRPDQSRSILIYPGHGYIDEPVRIVVEEE